MAFDTILRYVSEYTPNPWVQAGIILILFTTLSRFGLFLTEKVFLRIVKPTKTKLVATIVEKSRGPFFLLFITLGVQAALVPLQPQNNIYYKLPATFSAVLFVITLSIITKVLIEYWGKVIATRTNKHADDTILPLFIHVQQVLFSLIGFLWALDIWEINITPYLSGLGIGGVIVGLALQDSLKNIFGGISLTLDKNFNLSDTIKLESGEVGIVQDIGLRSTKLLTPDNEVIFVPNSQLSNMRILNYTKPSLKVRKTVAFSVEYGTDTNKVKTRVLNALKTIKGIYKEPKIDVMFVDMGESGLKFQARFYTDWNALSDKRLEAAEAIYTALKKAGITIPYPTHTVYVKKEE